MDDLLKIRIAAPFIVVFFVGTRLTQLVMQALSRLDSLLNTNKNSA